MFLALQFPFADLREFLGDEGGRLPSPKVALPKKIGRDFIRSSGLIRRRRKGGVKEWAGEELYCSGELALRFPNRLGDMQFGTGSVKGAVVDTFRRFHSKGPVARFEVAFQLRVKYRDFDEASAPEWFALLRDVLQIPMHKRYIPQKRLSTSKILNPSESLQGRQTEMPTKVNLIHAGNVLAQHYLAATTNRQLIPQVELQPWWYCPGTPALIVEIKEPYSLPMALPHAREVLHVPDASASIFHAWLEFDNQPCSAWFFAMGEGDPDAVRRLRINLTRLHAERECLNLVLANIGTTQGCNIKLGDNLKQLDAIQQYLNDALVSIQKPKRFGISQASMFEVAHDAFEIAIEGQEATLQEMGWQVAEKVDNYIRRAENNAKITTVIKGDVVTTNIQLDNVCIGGDFNVATAKNIEKSFNRVKKAEVNSDLKEKLKLLTVEVAKLAKELPSDNAEKLTRDLDNLTSEALSAKPRRKWYELSAEGILEAAKAVANVTESVTKAVTAVVATLAGLS
ncbi:MAG: hypothetical protein GXP46_02155 [Deferribacteres bacterium]|nr:hypothetical protein [Deferribacteres bacterium]